MMLDSEPVVLKNRFVSWWYAWIDGETAESGATGGEIIENPILSNFKEGFSILEYFHFYPRCS
jgi:hypothetical protein